MCGDPLLALNSTNVPAKVQVFSRFGLLKKKCLPKCRHFLHYCPYWQISLQKPASSQVFVQLRLFLIGIPSLTQAFCSLMPGGEVIYEQKQSIRPHFKLQKWCRMLAFVHSETGLIRYLFAGNC
ncbi:hypothetical protein K0T92_10610 [Paenibacillus oenotherae]|uniref:Uncharacterized protein n=1 Tax=Paenibacillus oenotherae TaxID=1435645 RepID=A0ABS7D5I6_9BACL|nr:hypothetical protein [Paenibacillus oenotherae]MBW7475199.1 hypothetical protein [Paenibacillus oenotherae]